MEPKKRKVEYENRQFLPEWTDLYCFTLPNRAGAVPMCLICNQTVAIIKSSNIKRHYDTKHKSFAGNFPLGSDLRKSKIASLLSSYSSSTQIISRSMTEQEKCGEASLRISWTLAKHMKPFTDADVVKECFLEAGNALFENKKDVVETIRRIPLSASTSTRNTHVLAEENHCDLKQQLNNANYYALAMDESCDVTDTAQLIIFVRYLDKTRETFVEEVLALLPLLGRTRGEDMIKAVMDYFEKDELDLKKLLSVTTDGAPAMVGSKKGLVRLLRSNERCNENLISYHCIIHQTVLCCKLNHNFERIMQEVMKIVNFLRAKSSLQHRELKSFLEEVDAQYDDLLLHNNVRWLSKGCVLERFFSILEHLKTYLFNSNQTSANAYLSFLNEKENVAVIAFLTDIFKHINDLNIKLQGKGKLVCELMSDVKSFSRKLALFINDLGLGNECLHFPNLNKIISSDNETDVGQFKTFITDLESEFQKRFADFKKIENVVEILSSIYSLHPDGEWSNEAAIVFGSDKATLQMEMIDFQENTVLKHKQSEVSSEEFWIKFVCGNKYPELQKLALKLLTLFGSTYICEAAFSKMKFIKNKFRSRLTTEHLQDLMSIACTNFTPNFRQIIRNKKCHFSH